MHGGHQKQKMQQIHEVAKVDLEEITHSMELFNQSGKLEPMELANDETTPDENQ